MSKPLLQFLKDIAGFHRAVFLTIAIVVGGAALGLPLLILAMCGVQITQIGYLWTGAAALWVAVFLAWREQALKRRAAENRVDTAPDRPSAALTLRVSKHRIDLEVRNVGAQGEFWAKMDYQPRDGDGHRAEMRWLAGTQRIVIGRGLAETLLLAQLDKQVTLPGGRLMDYWIVYTQSFTGIHEIKLLPDKRDTNEPVCRMTVTVFSEPEMAGGTRTAKFQIYGGQVQDHELGFAPKPRETEIRT